MGYIGADGEAHSLTDTAVGTKYLKRLNRDDNGVIYGSTLEGMGFRLEELKVTH